MKRMVKNGDLLDVSEDGSGVSFGGNLKVGGTIIANGEIRGGDVSASKFYLGTEEMPLVKANPAGNATGTLEKIKIGNVAYNVGGGGGSNDRELTLIFPYPSTDSTPAKKVYVDDETYNKINSMFYETIKLYYNDGNPLVVLHGLNKLDSNLYGTKHYTGIAYKNLNSSNLTWYGEYRNTYILCYLKPDSDSQGKYFYLSNEAELKIPFLSQSKFDALYKLADKPTQDGTYVLKATVSGGAVTYTWVAQ